MLLNEINYIQNYIDLERLRFGERVHIKVNMIGNMENQSVPPLLFLTFIENCFKHGTVDNNNLNVLITFKVTNKNRRKRLKN